MQAHADHRTRVLLRVLLRLLMLLGPHVGVSNIGKVANAASTITNACEVYPLHPRHAQEPSMRQPLLLRVQAQCGSRLRRGSGC